MTDWKSIHSQLYRFLRKRTATESDAEDLTQDVLLKIHQHLQEAEASGKALPENPTQWLYRIARNALIDRYRRAQTAGHVIAPSSPIDDGKAPESGPEEADLMTEVASWLGTFVDQLPPAYRDAVKAVELDGMSQKDYGETLGMSYSGAKSRVQRGRQMLKDELLACCAFGFDRRGGIIKVTPHLTSGCVKDCDCTD